MKVLFIANYKDGDNGWSEAALKYILAMDSVGIDVVCRNIKLNNINGNVPKRIQELEQKDLNNVDVSIQHVLPEMMTQDKKISLNIGMYYGETKWRGFHPWKHHLNKMDHLFVPNEDMSENHEKDKCTVIPVPIDGISSYKNRKLVKLDSVKGYKFYWAGDLSRRKNLSCLISSYYSTFNNSDNVTLILKPSKYGASPEQIKAEVMHRCKTIAGHLRLYSDLDRYPSIHILPFNLKRDDLLNLHHTCDCLVYPSFGEGWGMIVADALALNKRVILNPVGGMKYMKNILKSDSSGIESCKNMEEIVIGSDHQFKQIYTARESWYIPSSLDIGRLMKKCFNNKKEVDNSEIFNSLSYTNNRNMIKNIIKE